jgi:hypothetical protein
MEMQAGLHLLVKAVQVVHLVLVVVRIVVAVAVEALEVLARLAFLLVRAVHQKAVTVELVHQTQLLVGLPCITQVVGAVALAEHLALKETVAAVAVVTGIQQILTGPQILVAVLVVAVLVVQVTL